MKKTFETRTKIAVFYNGKQISPYEFSKTKKIKDYLIAYSSTLFTIYDSNGNSVLSERMRINLFCNDYFIVSKKGYVGVYRYDGILIVPVEFNYVNFWDTGILVYKDELQGAYSYDGTLIVPIEFTKISFPKPGTIIVRRVKNGPREVYQY